MSLATIPEVLEALRSGKPVIVADDESRENEGDAILAAELATPQWIAWMVRHTSGFLCAPMTADVAQRLNLPPMVERNEDSRRTAYTVSVDASGGITTGISASDRAYTLRALADPLSTPESFIRPGHVLPVVAVPGGLRARQGHTEATVELLRLAGLSPVGVIGELVEDDGDMMRMPGLLELGAAEGLPVTTTGAIIAWLNEHDVPVVEQADTATTRGRVSFEVETVVPTFHGDLLFRAYHDTVTGADHLAVISGEVRETGMTVRVHSECLTGEVFGSLKCECGPQLEAAMEVIQKDGGVVVYLRGHEGRGIGLINKLRAYALQDTGLDTFDANIALGLPADSRDYGAAAAILDDLGITDLRLLTNNPDKVDQLEAHGISVTERLPLIVGINAGNQGYLDAKRDRMGHFFPVVHQDATGLVKGNHA